MSDGDDDYEQEDLDQQRQREELFGDDDDEQDYNPNQEDEGLEDELYDRSPAADKAQPAGPPTDDRRALLAKLAEKKRKETDGTADGSKKRKKKTEKPSGHERKDKKPSKSGARHAEEDAPENSVDSREVNATAADDAFIDDEGVEHHVGSDDDDGPALPAEEAEEARPDEEEEQPFGKKKRRKNEDNDNDKIQVVIDKLAKMEAAAEEDVAAHSQGQPAVHKLKMITEVEDFLAQRKYHEFFLTQGGLGVLKAWLEPYQRDGSLPNIRVRNSILKICKNLPIDTFREDIKESLKKSMLGTRVMFLVKCPDETQENKAIARELVQKWSRPIFYSPELEEDKRKLREQQLKLARQQTLGQQKAVEAKHAEALAVKNKIKFGQPGYRWHASIPMASKLDYVVDPTRDGGRDDGAAAAAAASAAGANAAPREDRFQKKMREVQRKKKSTSARAAAPSVEGRGIVLIG